VSALLVPRSFAAKQSKRADSVTSHFVTTIVDSWTLAYGASISTVAIVLTFSVAHDAALRDVRNAKVKELLVPRATRGLSRRQQRCTEITIRSEQDAVGSFEPVPTAKGSIRQCTTDVRFFLQLQKYNN
jgi:hypothetical protein